MIRRSTIHRYLLFLASFGLFGLLWHCSQSVVIPGTESTSSADSGENKDAITSHESTQNTEYAVDLPDVPTTLFPCGPFGVCADSLSSAPCGTHEWTPTSTACTTSDGKAGLCCVFPGSCGAGGYCRPGSETTCRSHHQASTQRTCMLDKTTSSVCCQRMESSGCDQQLAQSLLSMTGTFLPTGLTRISLLIKAAQLPPTWFLEKPTIHTAPNAPNSWQIEQIRFDPQKNQQVELQIGFTGREPLPTLTVVLSAFLNLAKSGLPDEKQCSVYRTWQVQFKSDGTIDIQ